MEACSFAGEARLGFTAALPLYHACQLVRIDWIRRAPGHAELWLRAAERQRDRSKSLRKLRLARVCPFATERITHLVGMEPALTIQSLHH